MFCHLQVDRWADQHCIGDQGEPGQPERDIWGGEQSNTFIWLFLSGCSNQAEWFDEQIPNDQQLGEQDQLPQEEGHHHLGGCDWVVPCLHALVHIWLARGKWSSALVISYMYDEEEMYFLRSIHITANCLYEELYFLCVSTTVTFHTIKLKLNYWPRLSLFQMLWFWQPRGFSSICLLLHRWKPLWANAFCTQRKHLTNIVHSAHVTTIVWVAIFSNGIVPCDCVLY